MKAYLDIVQNVLENGEKVKTRQGTNAYTIAGAIFEHDMAVRISSFNYKKSTFSDSLPQN